MRNLLAGMYKAYVNFVISLYTLGVGLAPEAPALYLQYQPQGHYISPANARLGAVRERHSSPAPAHVHISSVSLQQGKQHPEIRVLT